MTQKDPNSIIGIPARLHALWPPESSSHDYALIQQSEIDSEVNLAAMTLISEVCFPGNVEFTREPLELMLASLKSRKRQITLNRQESMRYVILRKALDILETRNFLNNWTGGIST